MFSGLRTRLFLSYILIIVITLLVIGAALFVVLRSGSQVSETASLRMFNLLNQIVALQEERGMISSDGPTRIQRVILNQVDKRLNQRILVANSKGIVSFDSRRQYPEGQQIVLDAKPYIAPAGIDTFPFPVMRGVFQNPDKSEWIFLAQAPDSNVPDQQLLIVAMRAPRLLSFQETMQYYGQEWLTLLYRAGLIGLVVAFILSLVITSSVARPLQDVSKAAAAVAAGHLDQSAPVHGPREVRTVAEAFNHMSEQVEQSQKAQRDFLANVTHDLRTPLTSIQGFSQAIIDGVASDPAAAQRAAQIIHDEAGRLNRMVQELLDLARIEAGRFSMTRHSIRLSDILNAVAERLTPRAAEKGLTLTVEVPPLPLIAGDGDRLGEVFTNLVGNAVKHEPPGGTVVRRAGPPENRILVQVCEK